MLDASATTLLGVPYKVGPGHRRVSARDVQKSKQPREAHKREKTHRRLHTRPQTADHIKLKPRLKPRSAPSETRGRASGLHNFKLCVACSLLPYCCRVSSWRRDSIGRAPLPAETEGPMPVEGALQHGRSCMRLRPVSMPVGVRCRFVGCWHRAHRGRT